MRFTIVILSAFLCLNAYAAENASTSKDSAEDAALVAAAEKLVSENKDVKASEIKSSDTVAAKTTDTSAPASIESKKESEIPLFTKSEKVQKSESSLLWRLVASLAFVIAVGGGLIFAGRRWSREKNKGGKKERIELLHQFHMGPKKSVALIRVAGETILIGCTDQNINMLKAVTLIDEELEGALGGNFNSFLEDDFTIEDMRKALTPRA